MSVFVVIYMFGVSVLSSPFYHIMIERFESEGSYNLQSECEEFSFYNNLVTPNDDGTFTIEYVDKWRLKFFSLGPYHHIESINILHTPLTNYEDFFLVDRKDIKAGNFIILASDKYAVSIGLSKYQFYDNFFQDFIRNYEKCIKHNFERYFGY